MFESACDGAGSLLSNEIREYLGRFHYQLRRVERPGGARSIRELLRDALLASEIRPRMKNPLTLYAVRQRWELHAAHAGYDPIFEHIQLRPDVRFSSNDHALFCRVIFNTNTRYSGQASGLLSDSSAVFPESSTKSRNVFR